MQPARRALALLGGMAIALTACTPDVAGRSKGGDDASSTTEHRETQAYSSAITANGDRYPEIEGGVALPSGTTRADLQELVEAERLPLGVTHGGFFETMTNAVRAKREAPDVIFLGDSMVQQGIDPRVFQEELSASAGREVTAFNAASSRARWGVNKMVARYLVEVDRVPDVVVLTLSTRAAERDDFYTTDVAPTPFSSVVEGCDRTPSKDWTRRDAAQCRADVEDPTERFREGGFQVGRALKGRMPQTSARVDENSYLRSDGMMIHPSMSLSEVRADSDERTERGFPGFPTVHEEASRDFGETARILREHGATVIATEIPYTPPHQKNLETFRDYDERRQESAKKITSSNDVPHYPVTDFDDWFGDGDARDAIHLAPQGARKFSRQLLEDTPGFREAVLEGLED